MWFLISVMIPSTTALIVAENWEGQTQSSVSGREWGIRWKKIWSSVMKPRL